MEAPKNLSRKKESKEDDLSSSCKFTHGRSQKVRTSKEK